MKKKYRSKRSIIEFIPAICILLFFVPVFIIGKFDYLIILNIICMTFLQIFILTVPTHYIIDNETLIIRQGFSKIKIDIHTIKKVKETKRKIEIRYKKYDNIKISPKDKYGFINDLTSVNSDIEVVYC